MTLYYSTLFAGVILILFPIVAPSVGMYIVVAVIMNLVLQPVGMSPLIQDYVVKESQGSALSFSMMGLSLGVIMSLSVLFQFTKTLDPMVSWGFMSIIMILFALSLLVIVTEPKLPKKDMSLGYMALTWDLTKKTFRAMKENKNLMIGYILLPFSGGPMIILEIYVMSLLMGFYNETTGPIYDIETVYKLY